MKIYLCTTVPDDKSYTWVSSMAAFNDIVEDSEATSIVCDHFLLSFTYKELQEVLKRLASKMRLKSELVLIHPDMNLLSLRLIRGEIDEPTLNNILFKCGPLKSVFSTEGLQELIPPNIQIFHKHFDVATSNIIIKARRIQ